MSTTTVIVTPRVLLREGIASLLKGTRYKVVASAAKPAELSSVRGPKGQQSLAIVGIDLKNENLDEIAESVRLVRSLLTDSKVVLVAESDGGIDSQRILALSPDGCIFNLGSRDALIKVFELIFLDHRVFLFANSITTIVKEDIEFTDPASDSQSDDPSWLGINDHKLSPRESQVLACLAQGNSNKAIARLHNLSDAAVKVHIKAILRKTKVHNRTQAALWAIQHGFRNHFSEDSGLIANVPEPCSSSRHGSIIPKPGRVRSRNDMRR
jgi:two-component system, NarL family, nitrate/nitrite response regulator NarL